MYAIVNAGLGPDDDAGASAIGALARLGVSEALILEALARGRAFRRLATADFPAGVAGVMFYGQVTAALRDLLRFAGWTAVDEGGVAYVVSPDAATRIVVMAGASGTGDPDRTPQSRYPRGTNQVAAIARNERQLSLFPVERLGEVADGSDVTTWALLHDFYGDVVHSELSLPTRLDASGRAAEWKIRLLMADLQSDGDVAVAAPSPQPNIDVPVKRRHGA